MGKNGVSCFFSYWRGICSDTPCVNFARFMTMHAPQYATNLAALYGVHCKRMFTRVNTATRSLKLYYIFPSATLSVGAVKCRYGIKSCDFRPTSRHISGTLGDQTWWGENFWRVDYRSKIWKTVEKEDIQIFSGKSAVACHIHHFRVERLKLKVTMPHKAQARHMLQLTGLVKYWRKAAYPVGPRDHTSSL